MNPQARPPQLSRDTATGRRHGVGVGQVADALEWEELPSLAHILQHYREHGTVARTVAVWNPTQPQGLAATPQSPAADARPFAELIEGLQTRELDGSDLFEHFFGPEQR